MRSDPEPYDHIFPHPCSERTIMNPYPHRVNGRSDGLKLQTRMIGVLLEQTVRHTCLGAHHLGELREGFTEIWVKMRDHKRSGSSGSVLPATKCARARSASFARASCELAKESAQRCSSLSSSRDAGRSMGLNLGDCTNTCPTKIMPHLPPSQCARQPYSHPCQASGVAQMPLFHGRTSHPLVGIYHGYVSTPQIQRPPGLSAQLKVCLRPLHQLAGYHQGQPVRRAG